MKIEITQDISGTGDYRWSLETGPERIDSYTGYCYTLGECFEKIVMWNTYNAQKYYEGREMTNEEKLTLLLKVLKEYAEAKTCYDVYGDDYTPSADSYDTAFEDGGDYGEIHLARTLLEQIGEKFEYPCMKEND